METTLFRKKGRGNAKLLDNELYDVVIALISYNKINPRRRWSDIAEKIMTMLHMTVVYDNGQEVLYFENEDKEFS